MLVLSRRIGESIRIGDGITVSVVKVHGNRVHLAIDAPREVSVHREEVYRRIEKEQNASPAYAEFAGEAA